MSEQIICAKLLLWQRLKKRERADALAMLHLGRQDALRLARVLDKLSAEYAEVLRKATASSAAIGLLEALEPPDPA